VLSGQVLGQLSSLLAAPFIRSGQLVPLLVPHITDQMGVYVYYGNRTQPTRVRKFIDTLVERLSDPTPYWLSPKELAVAEATARKAAALHR